MHMIRALPLFCSSHLDDLPPFAKPKVADAYLQRVLPPKQMERSTIACTRHEFTISRDIHAHHLSRIRRQVAHHIPFVRRPDTDVAVKSGCDEEHAGTTEPFFLFFIFCIVALVHVHAAVNVCRTGRERQSLDADWRQFARRPEEFDVGDTRFVCGDDELSLECT